MTKQESVIPGFNTDGSKRPPAQGHTPGPWHTKDRDGALEVQDKERLPVAEIFGNGYTEAQANARLIASAPDLLAACKAVAGVFEGQEDMPLYARKCTAAIAKAEGH